jgi:hypothetical protein
MILVAKDTKDNQVTFIRRTVSSCTLHRDPQKLETLHVRYLNPLRLHYMTQVGSSNNGRSTSPSEGVRRLADQISLNFGEVATSTNVYRTTYTMKREPYIGCCTKVQGFGSSFGLLDSWSV